VIDVDSAKKKGIKVPEKVTLSAQGAEFEDMSEVIAEKERAA